jgi:hypothetical protein
MLAELRALGIPAEPELLKRAAEEIPAAPAKRDVSSPAAGGDVESPAQALRRMEPQRIADAVRDEPPALIADLLMIGDWPWRAALLASLPAVKRRQVEELLLGRGPCAPKLAGHLVSLLLLQVRNAVDSDVASPPVQGGAMIRREAALPGLLANAWRRLRRTERGGAARGGEGT